MRNRDYFTEMNKLKLEIPLSSLCHFKRRIQIPLQDVLKYCLLECQHWGGLKSCVFSLTILHNPVMQKMVLCNSFIRAIPYVRDL